MQLNAVSYHKIGSVSRLSVRPVRPESILRELLLLGWLLEDNIFRDFTRSGIVSVPA